MDLSPSSQRSDTMLWMTYVVVHYVKGWQRLTPHFNSTLFQTRTTWTTIFTQLHWDLSYFSSIAYASLHNTCALTLMLAVVTTADLIMLHLTYKYHIQQLVFWLHLDVCINDLTLDSWPWIKTSEDGIRYYERQWVETSKTMTSNFDFKSGGVFSAMEPVYYKTWNSVISHTEGVFEQPGQSQPTPPALVMLHSLVFSLI